MLSSTSVVCVCLLVNHTDGERKIGFSGYLAYSCCMQHLYCTQYLDHERLQSDVNLDMHASCTSLPPHFNMAAASNNGAEFGPATQNKTASVEHQDVAQASLPSCTDLLTASTSDTKIVSNASLEQQQVEAAKQEEKPPALKHAASL